MNRKKTLFFISVAHTCQTINQSKDLQIFVHILNIWLALHYKVEYNQRIIKTSVSKRITEKKPRKLV